MGGCSTLLHATEDGLRCTSAKEEAEKAEEEQKEEQGEGLQGEEPQPEMEFASRAAAVRTGRELAT